MEMTVADSKSVTETATDSQEKEIQELTDIFIEHLPSFLCAGDAPAGQRD